MRLVLTLEFILAFFIPSIGVIMLIGMAPTTLASIFVLGGDLVWLATAVAFLLLAVGGVLGLWAASHLLAIQLFPSIVLAKPRALYAALASGGVVLLVAIALAADGATFLLIGLLLPFPVTIHLLMLYRSAARIRVASDG